VQRNHAADRPGFSVFLSTRPPRLSGMFSPSLD
jgi:hypothetical protein